MFHPWICNLFSLKNKDAQKKQTAKHYLVGISENRVFKNRLHLKAVAHLKKIEWSYLVKLSDYHKMHSQIINFMQLHKVIFRKTEHINFNLILRKNFDTCIILYKMLFWKLNITFKYLDLERFLLYWTEEIPQPKRMLII